MFVTRIRYEHSAWLGWRVRPTFPLPAFRGSIFSLCFGDWRNNLRSLRSRVQLNIPSKPIEKTLTFVVNVFSIGWAGGMMPLRVIRPCGTAAADFAAENNPPDCFLHAAHPLRVRIPPNRNKKQETPTKSMMSLTDNYEIG